jgi:hypothetical protein
VCTEKPEVNVMLNLETTTVKTLEERILKVGLKGMFSEIFPTFFLQEWIIKGSVSDPYSFYMDTDTDPDPFRIQGSDDQN